MQVAAGIIGAPPVPKGATAFQYTVSTQAGSRTKKSSAKSSLRLARMDKSRACAISRGWNSLPAINGQQRARRKTGDRDCHFPAPGLERTRHFRRGSEEDG